MSKRRQKYSPEFKAKVVLEVLKENETLSEIAGRYGVHPTQIAKWRRALVDRAPEIFSEPGRGKAQERVQNEDELYKKIGQLQIELDWLKKKSGISI
jgi:transposase-like protein